MKADAIPMDFLTILHSLPWSNRTPTYYPRDDRQGIIAARAMEKLRIWIDELDDFLREGMLSTLENSFTVAGTSRELVPLPESPGIDVLV